MISGTYNLSSTDVSQNPIQELWLECDTTLAPVTINLFEIAELQRQWTIKIHISDATNNAGNNNIVINTGGADGIDGDFGSSITISNNGGSIIMLVASEATWFAIEGSGGLNNQYKFRNLPSTSLTHEWVVPENVMAEVLDQALPFSPPYIRLTNGNIAVVDYCSALMKNGIYIFECYDLQTLDPIIGYWVAMRSAPTNSNKLEKVAELQMTSQFWNNFYTYIVNDIATPNKLTFVTYITPFNSGVDLESYVTELIYTNGILTATDNFFDYGGQTALGLYGTTTGIATVTLSPDYTEPLFSGDDNFVDMMIGTEMGWVLYWDTSGVNYPLGASIYTWVVGYNVLTGATKGLEPIVDLATVTNFSPVDIEQAIVSVYSHPKGMLCFLDDQLIPDNISVDGVTAIWSPEWLNNKICTRLNSRGLDYTYANTNGSVANNWGVTSPSFPSSPDYFYCFDSDPNNPITFMTWRWKIDSTDEYEFNAFPCANELLSPVFVFAIPTPNGFMFLETSALLNTEWSPDASWFYWADSEKQPIQLQWNGILPTNFLNNRLLDTSDFATLSNWMTYGVVDNIYTNIKF